MGNAGSTSMHRERHKSSDLSTPNSPFRDLPLRGGEAGGGTVHGIATVSGGQAFTFDKKPDSSQEDDETTEPYYTKPVGKAAVEQQQTAASAIDPEFSASEPRKRSSTISEGTTTSTSVTTQQIMSQHKDSSSSSAADADDEESLLQKQQRRQLDEDDYRNPALPTVLRWDGGGQNVLISGTFTKWKPIPMVRSHGNFVTIIDLPEGDHQYKFYVDGEWKHDPKLKSVENDVGEKSNLVSVRQSDFEVFQALAKDSENCVNNADKEYSQDVPQVKPWEKVSGPPILPPHLLQVILNKDTPLSCEPTLLPEPNHVMLNHLYALSIKDGVMVLSATHRYRKKYVTTLLYKPI